MKTKFNGIPKAEGKKFWDMALDAYNANSVSLIVDPRRLRYNAKAIESYYLYKLTAYQYMKFYRSPGQSEAYRIEFVAKYNEGSVTFVVTNEEWPRKLFSDLYALGAIEEEFKSVVTAN